MTKQQAQVKEMKGIVVAAGFGTRLFPSTIVTSKQLLPVYDRPMIFYPLDVLIKGGITDILVIVSPEHSGDFINLLGSVFDGYGIKLSFKVQSVPHGLPEALTLGENHVDDNNVALILGDNIFQDDFSRQIGDFRPGGHVFVKKVPDPERFGVVKLDAAGRPELIVEKPKDWISDYAITGLYLFDKQALAVAKELKPSNRGELEIVDLHNHYLSRGELELTIFEGAWMDAGNHDSLLETSIAVRDLGISRHCSPLLREALEEFSRKQIELVKKRIK